MLSLAQRLCLEAMRLGAELAEADRFGDTDPVPSDYRIIPVSVLATLRIGQMQVSSLG